MDDRILLNYDYRKDAQEKIDDVWNIISAGNLSSSLPTLYLLGGQPGAGKSQALERCDLLESKNILKINGDDYRPFSEIFDYCNKTYGKDAPKYTAGFAGTMVGLVRDRAIQNNFNVAIEGTFRTTEVPLKELKLFKEKGYNTCVLICTCPKDVSWNSTLYRAMEMEKEGLPPRYVAKDHHDYVVEHLAENVKTVFDSGLVDHLEIMSREKVLFNSAEQIDYDSQRIIEVINGELNRNVNLQHGIENSRNLEIHEVGKGRNR